MWHRKPRAALSTEDYARLRKLIRDEVLRLRLVDAGASRPYLPPADPAAELAALEQLRVALNRAELGGIGIRPA